MDIWVHREITLPTSNEAITRQQQRDKNNFQRLHQKIQNSPTKYGPHKYLCIFINFHLTFRITVEP